MRNWPDHQCLYDPLFEHDACGVGFVCDIAGKKSRATVRNALTVLRRLAHRGARGADPDTGDGAGILLQVPHAFLARACEVARIPLPAAGEYATGILFLPRDRAEREFCRAAVAAAAAAEGIPLLGWREVPVDELAVGATARASRPAIEQVFLGRPAGTDGDAFERALYVVRRQAETAVLSSDLREKDRFAVTNLSARTLTYKGLLLPSQLDRFYPDLREPDVASAICLVHSRYSTNTFPTWTLAQPFRFLAHNGEINTLRGNINWTRAKEDLLASAVFGERIAKLKPVIIPGGSDSAALDNILELLVLSGRSMPHAMMMLVPAAWEHDRLMDPRLRDFYRYHACVMEPWDGPAALAFTDGTRVGAALDRNGLRPARYLVTRGGTVVMASEAGVLDIDPADITVSGRLSPGRMLFVDTAEGRIVPDEEVKERAATSAPYGRWLRENLVEAASLPPGDHAPPEPSEHGRLMHAFGYTREDLKLVLAPMAEHGEEPVGSMGSDTPHAVLSTAPQPLYSYFKQLFAQVTNPAIDPIREELVMGMESFLGNRRNLLAESGEHCRKLHLEHPLLTDAQLAAVRALESPGFHSATISLLYPAAGGTAFTDAIERICREAADAVKAGATILILSDRGVCGGQAALPALLAVGAVHQHLVRQAIRSQTSIILETGEPREVHHFAVLFGFGAGCVNPYLALDTVERLAETGAVPVDGATAAANYLAAVRKGILKILSKMGIATIQSYRGAQIFECVGLGPEVIARCFDGTPSRVGGAGFAVLAEECRRRHAGAFTETAVPAPLPGGGFSQWRRDGEFHLWNPDSIAALQQAVRADSQERYREFARLINDQSAHPTTLRGLLRFRPGAAVPLDEVEPADAIVRRFATGAMSFGSLSKAAHEAIAIAMNRLGGRSNTGEGGEDPARFRPGPNGDSTRSAVKQVASGRFGVTTGYLVNADEIQIKIAQGAKPGEGGQLPGHKVSPTIARIRCTTPGVTLISPPPHHDIYSIEDLAQLIFDLKNVNPHARISVKLVSEIGVGTVAMGVAKGHADVILVSGGDGGTGASPLSSIRHAGLPWELGLSETHQTLLINGLRDRVRLQTDGQMRTGRDVAVAACLGADEYGFCTAVLVTLGCVLLRHCHLNNCSVGIACQEPRLERRFAGAPEHIVRYLRFVAGELREIMAELGVRRLDELVGRTDLLELDRALLPWKAAGLDYARILRRPRPFTPPGGRRPRWDAGRILDRALIRRAGPVLRGKRRSVRFSAAVRNTDRAVGAMLSGRVCALRGIGGLPGNSIRCDLRGTAGQSLGAWLIRGVTLTLKGMANDYVGKGLSGGRLVVRPDDDARLEPGGDIIIGNTAFYGATSGEAFIRGAAGERFCVRNSGIEAVVEGLGDHGCEYMTGGRVLVLGPTGRNFAAGMSGGIAYLYDPDGRAPARHNPQMVDLESPDAGDLAKIRELLERHARWTKSPRARELLASFASARRLFVKVMPREYRRVLEGKRPERTPVFAEAADG